MPIIEVERSLFERLANKYLQLDHERRAYRLALKRIQKKNPDIASEIDFHVRVAKDWLQGDWMEIDKHLTESWAVEDDPAFLQALALLLSAPESGEEDQNMDGPGT